MSRLPSGSGRRRLLQMAVYQKEVIEFDEVFL